MGRPLADAIASATARRSWLMERKRSAAARLCQIHTDLFEAGTGRIAVIHF
jgi:hypothetical protein